MNVKSPVPTDLSVHGLEDLHRLKALMETAHLKINKSQIARELGVDRRTVDKYLNGFTKSRKILSGNFSRASSGSCSITEGVYGSTSVRIIITEDPIRISAII